MPEWGKNFVMVVRLEKSRRLAFMSRLKLNIRRLSHKDASQLIGNESHTVSFAYHYKRESLSRLQYGN
jgi:hypothetical protein